MAEAMQSDSITDVFEAHITDMLDAILVAMRTIDGGEISPQDLAICHDTISSDCESLFAIVDEHRSLADVAARMLSKTFNSFRVDRLRDVFAVIDKCVVSIQRLRNAEPDDITDVFGVHIEYIIDAIVTTMHKINTDSGEIPPTDLAICREMVANSCTSMFAVVKEHLSLPDVAARMLTLLQTLKTFRLNCLRDVFAVIDEYIASLQRLSDAKEDVQPDDMVAVFKTHINNMLDVISTAMSKVKDTNGGGISPLDFAVCHKTVANGCTSMFSVAYKHRSLAQTAVNMLSNTLGPLRSAWLSGVFAIIDTYIASLLRLRDVPLPPDVSAPANTTLQQYSLTLSAADAALTTLLRTRGTVSTDPNAYIDRSTWINDRFKKKIINLFELITGRLARELENPHTNTTNARDGMHSRLSLLLWATGFGATGVFKTNPVLQVAINFTRQVQEHSHAAALADMVCVVRQMKRYTGTISIMSIRSDMMLCEAIATHHNLLILFYLSVPQSVKIFRNASLLADLFIDTLQPILLVDLIMNTNMLPDERGCKLHAPLACIGLFDSTGVMDNGILVPCSPEVTAADVLVYQTLGSVIACQTQSPMINTGKPNNNTTYSVYDHMLVHVPDRVQLVRAFETTRVVGPDDPTGNLMMTACPLIAYDGFFFNVDNVPIYINNHLLVERRMFNCRRDAAWTTFVAEAKIEVRRAVILVLRRYQSIPIMYMNDVCRGHFMMTNDWVDGTSLEMAKCFVCNQCMAAVDGSIFRIPTCIHCKRRYIEASDAIVEDLFDVSSNLSYRGLVRTLNPRMTRDQLAHCGMHRILAENNLNMPVYMLDTTRLLGQSGSPSVAACEHRVWSMAIEGNRLMHTNEPVIPTMCLRLYPVTDRTTGNCIEILAIPAVICKDRGIMSYTDARGLDGPVIVCPNQEAFVEYFTMAYAQTSAMQPQAILLRSAADRQSSMSSIHVAEINTLAASVGSVFVDDENWFAYNPAGGIDNVGGAHSFPVRCSHCSKVKLITQFVSGGERKPTGKKKQIKNNGSVCFECTAFVPAITRSNCTSCGRAYVWCDHNTFDEMCSRCRLDSKMN